MSAANWKMRVGAITTCSVMLSAQMAPAFAQTTPTTPQSGAPPKQAAPAAKPAATKQPSATSTVDRDGGWPRAYMTSSGAAMLVYQPQVASWQDQKHMVLYLAVSYTPKGADKPALGSVKAESDTKVAVAERLVSFSDIKITSSNFPTLKPEQARVVVEEITREIPADERVIALDRVLARLDKSQIMPKNVEGLKADPPVIFSSTTPAVLVNIDGDPIWSPIRENDLKFAVNTNWDLFQHTPSNTFYLRNNQSWLQASAVEGPWKAAGKLPDSFSKLPDEANWAEVKAALPGKPLESAQVPKVFVSTKPAELILLTGAPNYLLVTGTQLLWVSNTESDLFRLGKTGSFYYLVAGRWFTATDLNGPWTFATTSLPADFKKIPPEHKRSRVLASVPGTDQAAEAILLAQIPETARVSKKTVAAPEVAFQGEPQFQAIESTSVARAVNTDKDIMKVGDLYYMCYEGVWFVSKTANGPWEVTGSVPQQIYEIPPSSPAHSVTYVTVVEDNSDEVMFATAAAATGMMVAWGCVVWGTGYYYPPYYGYGGFYPYYYPYYPTYGYGASYNPWTGAYTRGAVAYGPYGGAGVASRYNPRTGTYSRGAAAWGPYGSRGYAQAYNPRTGAYGATRQGSSVYGSWGQTGVRRGDDWATTSRVTNRYTGTTTRTTRTSEGGAAVTRNGPGASSGGVARTGSGDVYAGHDGNVYRKQGDSWQKYDNGGWNNVQQPTQQQRDQAQQRADQARSNAADRSSAGTNSTVGQLNSDAAARAEGAQRTRDAGRVNSGSAGSSSYRPSGGYRGGGGFRGGGGRRR